MTVVVVGAGLAGLLTACELVAAGMEVIVAEAGPEAGGVARTSSRDGFTLEPAAGTLMLPHPRLTPLLNRVGVETAPIGADRRYAFDGSRLIHLPASPRLLASPVLPWTAKLRAMAEPLIPRRPADDVSLRHFLTARLGRRTGELLAWMAACGVYAGDPDRLSVHSAFPMLSSLAGNGSLVRGMLARRRVPGIRPRPHLPEGGMAGLARALAGLLGKRVRYEAPVSGVVANKGRWRVVGSEDIPADRVVLATSPGRAAALVDAELGDVLGRAVSAPVAVVWLGGTGEGGLPPGFGALTTPDAGTVGIGYLFESSYAPRRAPEDGWLVKVIAGGATRPEVVDWEDDRLVSAVTEETGRLLGRDVTPTMAAVVRHSPGIPQYEVGHDAWLSTLDRLLRDRPGLHLTGWGYRGVGVAQIAGDAASVAASIAGNQVTPGQVPG